MATYFFLNPMIQKLLLQAMIGKLGLGNNHQSALVAMSRRWTMSGPVAS